MTKKEQHIIENNIQAKSKSISSRQFNYLCGQSAVRGDFYSRFKKNISR